MRTITVEAVHAWKPSQVPQEEADIFKRSSEILLRLESRPSAGEIETVAAALRLRHARGLRWVEWPGFEAWAVRNHQRILNGSGWRGSKGNMFLTQRLEGAEGGVRC